MIGQDRLLNEEFSQFVILIGKYGSGKKTLVREKFDDVVGVFSKVDDTRWVINDSRDLTSERVYLFDGNKMTYEAQNALLKITEEPNKYTRIVITGRFKEQFLETLHTRCEFKQMEEYSKSQLEKLTDNNQLIQYYSTPGLLLESNLSYIEISENIVDKLKKVNISNVFKIKEHFDEEDFLLISKPLKKLFKNNPECVKLISEAEYKSKKGYNFVLDELFLKLKEVV